MVVGWDLSNNMTGQDTVMAAFNKAIETRPILPGLVFHSDRGSQYANSDFRELLTNEKCKQSMSRKDLKLREKSKAFGYLLLG